MLRQLVLHFRKKETFPHNIYINSSLLAPPQAGLDTSLLTFTLPSLSAPDLLCFQGNAFPSFPALRFLCRFDQWESLTETGG